MRTVIYLAFAVATILPAVAAAAPRSPNPGADPSGNAFFVEYQKAEPSASSSSSGTGIRAGRNASSITYVLRNPCGVSIDAGAPVCPPNTCADGADIFRVVAVSAEGENPGGLTCIGDSPAQQAVAPPQVTDAMVLEAFRRIPVPQLRSVTQPADKTLVNFDTIFYAEAEGFTRTVTLLGRSVTLDVSPETFRWEFGDGTEATTRTAGAAYPSKDVVHRYQDARTTVRHRLVVTWGATWSLDGGPSRPVPGTVTTTGPTTALRIAEAVPALSGER